MSGLEKRREADIERLRALENASRGQLQILAVERNGSILKFRLSLPTAGSEKYPATTQKESRFEVHLPARYPFEAPTARMSGTPILHPNVFESGVICVGSRWVASEGLDLYVRRLAQLLCFDPLLVNLGSIANSRGGHWYDRARRTHPDAFPTAVIDWSTTPEKTIVACPKCSVKMRLPSGQSGTVACPKCQHEFVANT